LKESDKDLGRDHGGGHVWIAFKEKIKRVVITAESMGGDLAGKAGIAHEFLMERF